MTRGESCVSRVAACCRVDLSPCTPTSVLSGMFVVGVCVSRAVRWLERACSMAACQLPPQHANAPARAGHLTSRCRQPAGPQPRAEPEEEGRARQAHGGGGPACAARAVRRACTLSPPWPRRTRLRTHVPFVPTALAACCGFDLCHKYISYLYLYLYFVGQAGWAFCLK
jgi:hypothetical protein